MRRVGHGVVGVLVELGAGDGDHGRGAGEGLAQPAESDGGRGVACTKLEAEMLRILNDQRLAEVATRRFHGETLLEIGESLGVSRERVRQIESRAKPWLAGTTDEAEPHTEETDDLTPEGIRAAWFGMYQRLKEYHARHGDADVPSKWTEYPKLGEHAEKNDLDDHDQVDHYVHVNIY